MYYILRPGAVFAVSYNHTTADGQLSLLKSYPNWPHRCCYYCYCCCVVVVLVVTRLDVTIADVAFVVAFVVAFFVAVSFAYCHCYHYCCSLVAAILLSTCIVKDLLLVVANYC